MDDALSRFSEPVRTWFQTAFEAPTAAQEQGWPAIAAGQHTLILAPTGSGKTLTAFLWALDRLMTRPVPERRRRLRVVYVSPLRALAVDVDKNLRAPLEGIRLAAGRLGTEVTRPEVGVRTGDTPSSERERMRRNPPDVLITTPESLYLMLTSRARETLRDVEAVIVDEIHALAPTKRGSHLALTLERLEHEVLHGARAEDPDRRGGDAPGTDDRDPEEGAAPARTPPQRIALSATQRPLEEIARFLGGHRPDPHTGEPVPRPVTIVDAGVTKPLELEVVVPVEDLSELGSTIEAGRDVELSSGAAAAGPARRSIWPAVHPRLLERILEHRSTLVFVNARRMAERLAAKLNELHARQLHEDELRSQGLVGDDLEAALDEGWAAGDGGPPPELVKAHHGSLSRERRLQIEDELKSGRLRALVATSSLELGIDMGAVDLVVQVSSPGAVSRGLQRIGRAGHRVGEPSRGVLFPKFRGDLLETAVVTRRMHEGLIESSRYPRNPLDVLAQHVVAMTAMEEWSVDELAATVRGAAPFAELSDEVLHAVLDLLAGRYPSEEFSELRPRIVWDRIANTVRGRAGAQRLAVTNPGTIPDRGLFGVFLPDGTRVGELDEEMVHESRPGETFVLGATTWRIEDITYERVVVTPAPGEPGKLPFWHGDGPGRPLELGRALGAFVRESHAAAGTDRDTELARLRDEHDLDAWAADNVLGYLDEQAAATGVLPDDRTLVLERFRDELGDWRLCLLSPFGAQVHAPWAMAIEGRLRELGLDPEVMWADDGIVLSLQEATFGWAPSGADGAAAESDAGGSGFSIDELLLDPDEVEDRVVAQLSGTALFTSVFREAAGRALLLPRRRPGQRTALWQQRQRAAGLLEVASRYPTFPILLEATRECLRDVFDLPGLQEVLRELRSRRIRLVEVETPSASPFAQSLLFGWVGQYMYEYDAPLAERRAAALALDPDLLRELLGGDELRELLDAEVLTALEQQLQHLAPLDASADATRGDEPVHDPRAREADEVHDLLRRLGDLTREEVAERSVAPPEAWIDALLGERRAIEVRVAGEDRLAAAEDAARLRDGLGVAIPPGLPQAFTEPVEDPLGELVARYARTHGPFTTAEAAHRLGVPAPRVEAALRWLARSDRVVSGAFRPVASMPAGGATREWIDTEVLRRLKRRSLAALRQEVEPVDGDALGRFLPAWQGVVHAPGSPGRRRGPDALLETVAQLQGAPIPASVLEADVLPARIDGYRPGDLDQLLAAGEVVWLGVEPLGATDGRVVLCFRDQVGLLAPGRVDEDGTWRPGPGERPEGGEVHEALREHLRRRGASFWPELFSAAGVSDQDTVLAALWDLVWAGEITNDTYAPVRALLSSGGGGSRGRARPRPGGLRRVGPPAAAGRWSATEDLLADAPTPTERAHALAAQLLERHGVLSRESLRVESVAGGFSGVYRMLKAMEEAGRARRGYVVAGLGAAQFAQPGAIDRLRGYREAASWRDGPGEATDPPPPVTLAATDPAQPYGAALPWPPGHGRPGRTAGAFVVLLDGRPAAHLERGGRSLTTFDHPASPEFWLDGLIGLVRRGRLRKLEITRVDGVDVHETEWVGHLEKAGFTVGYRGLTLRS